MFKAWSQKNSASGILTSTVIAEYTDGVTTVFKK